MIAAGENDIVPGPGVDRIVGAGRHEEIITIPAKDNVMVMRHHKSVIACCPVHNSAICIIDNKTSAGNG